MAKHGENDPEDAAMKEEREARVDEMLHRAKRAHRPAPKKRVATKSARVKGKKRSS
jgi:hypothetical protein